MLYSNQRAGAKHLLFQEGQGAQHEIACTAWLSSSHSTSLTVALLKKVCTAICVQRQSRASHHQHTALVVTEPLQDLVRRQQSASSLPHEAAAGFQDPYVSVCQDHKSRGTCHELLVSLHQGLTAKRVVQKRFAAHSYHLEVLRLQLGRSPACPGSPAGGDFCQLSSGRLRTAVWQQLQQLPAARRGM